MLEHARPQPRLEWSLLLMLFPVLASNWSMRLCLIKRWSTFPYRGTWSLRRASNFVERRVSYCSWISYFSPGQKSYETFTDCKAHRLAEQNLFVSLPSLNLCSQPLGHLRRNCLSSTPPSSCTMPAATQPILQCETSFWFLHKLQPLHMMEKITLAMTLLLHSTLLRQAKCDHVPTCLPSLKYGTRIGLTIPPPQFSNHMMKCCADFCSGINVELLLSEEVPVILHLAPTAALTKLMNICLLKIMVELGCVR